MLTGGSGGIPSEGGVGAGPREAPMILPRYCGGGLGDVAEETEDESKERVDKLGERANALCGGAAMIDGDQQAAVYSGAELAVGK